jgi:hypothetical protein
MLEEVFDELARQQREKIKKFAHGLIPYLTDDDLLQPNDFPELERHPHFRYEEGVLEGILTARMAYLAWKKDQLV